MNTADRLFCYVGVPAALFVLTVLGGLHTDLIIKVRSTQADLLARVNENRRDLVDAMSAMDDLQAKCKNCDKSCERKNCGGKGCEGGCCCGEGCKCCPACSSICCPSNKGVDKECKCKECKCCCCCKGRQAKPVQQPLILPPPVPGPCKNGVSEKNPSRKLSRIQEVVGGNIYMEWIDNNGEYQNQIVTPEKFQTITQGSK